MSSNESMMTALNEPPKQTRKRKSTKKSRKGCLTCKLRKVKCDETLPECLRCQKLGAKCSGYKSPEPMSKSTNVPRIEARATLLPALPSILEKATETEQRYFYNFQQITARDLSSTFENPFWHRLVLQASLTEPFIFRAVIALSALGSSKKLFISGDNRNGVVASTIAYAYEQYQLAIRLMTSTLSKNASTRKAIIMCLLICCFEGLSGNTNALISHARSGRRLIENWYSTHPHPKPYEEGLYSPASYLIEDDLLFATYFFNHQVGFTSDKKPNDMRYHRGDETIRRMPDRFTDIHVGCLHLHLVLVRVMGFVTEGWKTYFPSQHSIYHNTILLPSEHDMQIPVPVEEINNFWNEYTKFQKEIQKSRAAFEGLYSGKFSRSRDKRLVIGAHTLWIYSLKSEILLTSLLIQPLIASIPPANGVAVGQSASNIDIYMGSSSFAAPESSNLPSTRRHSSIHTTSSSSSSSSSSLIGLNTNQLTIPSTSNSSSSTTTNNTTPLSLTPPTSSSQPPNPRPKLNPFTALLPIFRLILTLSTEILSLRQEFNLKAGNFVFDLGVIPALEMTAKWCTDERVRWDALALLEGEEWIEGGWESRDVARRVRREIVGKREGE